MEQKTNPSGQQAAQLEQENQKRWRTGLPKVTFSEGGLMALSYLNDKSKGITTEALTDLALGLGCGVYVDGHGYMLQISVYPNLGIWAHDEDDEAADQEPSQEGAADVE